MPRKPVPKPPSKLGAKTDTPPKRKPGTFAPYIPTDKDRATVEVMVAGGIEQREIWTLLGIKERTLRKHYRDEIDTGFSKINRIVLRAHLKKIQEGDFRAIEWWEKARMNWSERTIISDGGLADEINTLSDAQLETRLAQAERREATRTKRKPKGNDHA